MKQLEGPPPTRGDGFTIEWELGVPPVSRIPYRLALAEMAEVKKKRLDELLDKVFIKSSIFPWGACTEDGFPYMLWTL